MKSNSTTYPRILSWLVTLLIPGILVVGAVRIIVNPWYLNFEYHMPGFPPDEYGFTLQDRLHYAGIAFEYLVNNAGISFLGDLRFPEGMTVPPESCQFMTDCNLVYNERELKHMLDVKNTFKNATWVMYGSLAVVVLLGIWAWRGGWWDQYRFGIRRGGWLTLFFIGAIILAVLLSFGVLFVFFHNLFFAKGTWLFYTSDTLIRMFPERFFRDIFITVGGIAAILGLLVSFIPLHRIKQVN
jgi:integral membrane protein (TIGR01906 family)